MYTSTHPNEFVDDNDNKYVKVISSMPKNTDMCETQ